MATSNIFTFKELVYDRVVGRLWEEGRVVIMAPVPLARVTIGYHGIDAFKYDPAMGLVAIKFNGIAEWEDEWLDDAAHLFTLNVLH